MKFNLSRLAIIVEYLQCGGEVAFDENVWVWLDNKVVKETEDQEWIMDGLAIKAKRYTGNEDIHDPNGGEDWYMGQDHLTLNAFVFMINNLPNAEMVRIIKDLKEQRNTARKLN